MVTIRRARPEDAQPLSQLLQANTKENLTAEEREEGYITGGPPEDVLAAIAEDPGFAVAVDGTEVIGCVGASRFDQHEGQPVVEAMADACSEADFRGDSLSAYQTFLYGPAVVARGYRGRGVLSSLFENLIEIVSEEFEVGLAWIANENQASYAAHTDGLGMSPVTEFEVDEDQYTVLAFLIDEHEAR